jgi:hypothetical protein
MPTIWCLHEQLSPTGKAISTKQAKAVHLAADDCVANIELLGEAPKLSVTAEDEHEVVKLDGDNPEFQEARQDLFGDVC